MPKPQRYVFLSDSKVRVTPEQKRFVDARQERGVTIAQTVRDALQHAMTCPFFESNGITNGNVSPPEGAA